MPTVRATSPERRDRVHAARQLAAVDLGSSSFHLLIARALVRRLGIDLDLANGRRVASKARGIGAPSLFC